MKTQLSFPNFTQYSLQPLQNNFLAYLKAEDLSKQEIKEILYDLKNIFIETNDNTSLFYVIKFALDTINPVTRFSSREERKQECYYHYKKLESTGMKRSEKVRTIADKMKVNTDCIQVYLREIFSSSEKNPKNPN